MALWDAPTTPTVAGEDGERILERTGGLRDGSSPISLVWEGSMGSGPVVGWEPVQRTRSSEEMFVGPGNFSSAESILTFQCFDCLV